jgi:hypothetical protein
VLYCNDGDWVESLTALVEHHDGRLEIIDRSASLAPSPAADRDVAPAAADRLPPSALPMPQPGMGFRDVRDVRDVREGSLTSRLPPTTASAATARPS